MKTSTKLATTAAASILGVALAAGGAYAATGTLSSADVPGHVLPVSGVGPVAAHAGDAAKAHANADATGLVGAEVAASEGTDAAGTAAPEAAAREAGTGAAEVAAKSAQSAESSVKTATPATPSVASQGASAVSGGDTGKDISAGANTHAGVEAVAPDVAVSVGVDANASLKAGR